MLYVRHDTNRNRMLFKRDVYNPGNLGENVSASPPLKLLCISYLEHETNDWVPFSINFPVRLQTPLLAIVKRRKIAWFDYVTRQGSPSKAFLQGTLEGEKRFGRQRKCWIDNVKEWTSPPMRVLLRRASCRKDWRGSVLNRPSYRP